MKFTRITPLVLAAAGSMVASACGSSASANSGGSTSTSGATKSPINIMGSASLSGSNSPFPSTKGGWLAAVAEINASGGINGHPLNLQVCDTQGDPNISQSCAEKAVSNGDVAVLATSNTLSTAQIPTLQKAGIAYLGADVSDSLDATSSVSFPLASGAYTLNYADGEVAKLIGCKKASGVVIQAPNITGVLESSLKSSTEAAGLTYTGTVLAPVTQTNFTSIVAAVQAQGADCILPAIDQPQNTALLTAWKQSGYNMKIVDPGIILAPLDTIASVASGIYVFSPVRLATDPAVASTVAAVKKWAPGTAIDTRSIEGYATVQLLAQALKSITGGQYTAKTVLAALGTLNNASSGNVLPPITTTHDNPNSKFARVFNADIVIYKVGANGSTQAVSGWEPIPGVGTAS